MFSVCLSSPDDRLILAKASGTPHLQILGPLHTANSPCSEDTFGQRCIHKCVHSFLRPQMLPLVRGTPCSPARPYAFKKTCKYLQRLLLLCLWCSARPSPCPSLPPLARALPLILLPSLALRCLLLLPFASPCQGVLLPAFVCPFPPLPPFCIRLVSRFLCMICCPAMPYPMFSSLF